MFLNDYLLIRSATVSFIGISRAIQYITDIPPHPQQATFSLNFPTDRSTILLDFRDHIKKIPRKPGQKIVAVIDTIASVPGVLLPWQEMVEICKEEDVISVVDGAHSLGQEDINLKETDPDFWVSVSHHRFPQDSST